MFNSPRSLLNKKVSIMAGQGHQFPGGFPNNAGGMRSNFGAGPMGSQIPSSMPNQLGGVMGGSMANNNPMAGMASQMVQSYGTGMPNQMNQMAMGQQTMPVATAQQSPGLQGMAGGGTMAGMGSGMQGTGMGVGVGVTMPQGPPSGSMTSVPAASPANTVVGSVPQGPVTPAQSTVATQPQQNKEFNTASLCRFGQETVQDIVSRTQEVFQTLKAIQPPNGTSQGTNSSNEKKAKIQEQLRTIRLLFKRLRLIYEKCNENCQVPGMEYTHIESLIPLKEEHEHKSIDEKKASEAYKLVCDENRELTEQVVLKNKQLKEVINHLRTIIWEINVMLTMRRS